MGKFLLYIGLCIATIGVIVMVLGKFSFPIGKLPGDIQVDKQGWSFSFPIVSCLIVSLILTVLLNLFFYFKNR